MTEKKRSFDGLSDLEVNKIIAEFMGYHLVSDEEWHNENPGKLLYHAVDDQTDYIDRYTKSLDALVPVWGKLREKYEYYRLKLEIYPNVGVDTVMKINKQWINESNLSKDKTIQQAAAHATAKAILELRSNEDQGEEL